MRFLGRWWHYRHPVLEEEVRLKTIIGQWSPRLRRQCAVHKVVFDQNDDTLHGPIDAFVLSNNIEVSVGKGERRQRLVQHDVCSSPTTSKDWTPWSRWSNCAEWTKTPESGPDLPWWSRLEVYQTFPSNNPQSPYFYLYSIQHVVDQPPAYSNVHRKLSLDSNNVLRPNKSLYMTWARKVLRTWSRYCLSFVYIFNSKSSSKASSVSEETCGICLEVLHEDRCSKLGCNHSFWYTSRF